MFLGLNIILLDSQDMKFNKFSHATFNVGKCENSHMPTLDKNANLLFYMLGPLLHMEVLGQQNG